MYIGIPKEIKTAEFRVSTIPASVVELTRAGHSVLVETGAGVGIGASDADYIAAGAKIASSAEHVFKESELIVKVKEPQVHECGWLSSGQTLFTFLHLAAELEIAEALIASKCTAIAYETVTDNQGRLPLLAPMSQVAGRISVQIGARLLQASEGGIGVLLSGVPGVAPAKVVIIGGGSAGSHAATIALGMGAKVEIFDKNVARLEELENQFGGRLVTHYSLSSTLEQSLVRANLIISAVLVPGAAAPKLVTKDVLAKMQPGSVIVDIAIDQGGSLETSRPTTHDDPVYTVDGVQHCCITNLPGAVPRTSAYALNHATIPYIFELANLGVAKALTLNKHLANGLNVCDGHYTHAEVARSLNKKSLSVEAAIKAIK